MKKKVIKSILFVVGVVFIFTSGVVAATLTAKDVGFTASNEEWQVNNVEDAMNDLYEIGKEAKGKIYVLGTCTSGQSFSIANIVGQENVGNYSASNFLVVSGGISTSLEADADSDHTGHDATASFSFSAPSVSYNNTTGVVTVGGGSWNMSIYMKYSNQPSTSGVVTNTVYFIDNSEILTP